MHTGEWNVARADGQILMTYWGSQSEAEKWLDYYRTTYPHGAPMPGGGVYPDFGFHLVSRRTPS
jgi:hypothetical protein